MAPPGIAPATVSSATENESSASAKSARSMLAVGLMSGTSQDGIDAALIETDGSRVSRIGAFVCRPYEPDVRRALADGVRQACKPGAERASFDSLEQRLTDAHAEAVEALLDEAGLSRDAIDVVGFHGHTLLHRPDKRLTWQIGDGGRLAMRLGIPVVNDFRTADVADGGQGAPLAPIYHAARLTGHMAGSAPKVVLNIGGVANVTWIAPPSRPGDDPRMVAFDTGPGNALLDEWVRLHTGQPYDADGRYAASGEVHTDVLTLMLDHPYLDEAPPKSLDRYDFALEPVRGLSLEDGAATLAAFTVQTIVEAQAHMPAPPDAWYVTGGGRHNPVLLQGLRDRLPVVVEPVDALGWRADSIEAEAFAFLAVRHMCGLTTSGPATTGARHEIVGGRLHLVAGRG